MHWGNRIGWGGGGEERLPLVLVSSELNPQVFLEVGGVMEVPGAYLKTTRAICNYSVKISSELEVGHHPLETPAAAEEMTRN